ncbi:MAG: GNAT family N-acetyltransferase [Gemmatimonadaceae bacterium]|nr:GNAT family N-acetyltransferase [Gemmatimonadaceae bacterium]MDQ3517527.1 GNAT family N-acetyltransferase [Gemmatimonadota bacterium]
MTGPILQLTSEIAEHQESFLELEYLASRPYSEFVFGDESLARAVQRHLFQTGPCEYSPPEGQLALLNSKPVGILAALPGKLLKRRRLEAAMRLARSPFGRNDPDLSRRIRLAAQTMLSPNEDDWYFSRLALLSNARGVGVGFWLEEQVLAAGRRAGCRRCVLEVTPQSPEAIAIHTRYKFKISSRPRVEDPQTGRWLEYIHMELPL